MRKIRHRNHRRTRRSGAIDADARRERMAMLRKAFDDTSTSREFDANMRAVT
jgi:hypothetical protein